MNLKPIFSVIAIAGLAACGGGTTGGGTTGGGATFDGVLSDFRSSGVIDEVSSDATELVTIESLSAGGSATYTGTTLLFLAEDFSELASEPGVDLEGLEDLPDPSLVGQVNLTTSFSGESGTVNGGFSNFIDRNGNNKSGSISLDDGEVADFFGTAAFVATFDGALSGAGLGNGSYEGDLLGIFTPDGGVVGIGAEDIDEDVNDDASFAIVFVAED